RPDCFSFAVFALPCSQQQGLYSRNLPPQASSPCSTMTATRLPFRTYLYFLAQSINLTTAVMSVTMAALVGGSLAPEPWLSTVPYGFQFLFVMLFTLPASRLMAAIGRKKSFLLASLPLAASGVVGYWAIELKQFSWL